MRQCLILLAVISFFKEANAQKPKQPNASEIQLMLEKLNVLGSALYVAAHPDDENTQMITYLANEKKYNTAYLSATRGDGGQNLIGSEIRDQLGLIRTQELLGARRLDGGKQYFTRANDFGYSKSPEETLEIWNEEEVLEDFVRIFRKHRPDVIFTRFPEDGGGGHGHHTASAILAGQAFARAADKKVYPDLVEQYGIWQPKALFFNTHPWFFRRRGVEMDTSNYFQIDLGTYNPLLGKSYSEISAESRSMHKSQGFGSTGSRGMDIEYFEYKYGEKPQDDIFESIDASWNRVKGGAKVAEHVGKAIKNFDPRNPWTILDDLVLAYQAIAITKDEYWKQIKLEEIKKIIQAVTGTYLEVNANDYAYVPGDSISLAIEVINRSDQDITLTSIDIKGMESFEVGQKLFNNRPVNFDKHYKLSKDLEFSDPYWLKKQGSLGMYVVENGHLIGEPENPPSLTANVVLNIKGVLINYEVPIVFKRNDPVDGEVYRPVEITPPVFLNIAEKVYVFGDDIPRQVKINVIAGKAEVSGNLIPQVPEGWGIEPESVDFELGIKEEEKTFSFTVTPPHGQSVGIISAKAMIGGVVYDRGLSIVKYDHIPTQTLFPPASARIVRVALQKKGEKVGYIAGAGDEIPASLRQVGYKVVELGEGDISVDKMQGLDAVILGIRAFNTVERLKFLKDELMAYVKTGGTVIVQYNTAHRLVTEDFSPYPIELSRDRVSVEDAEIRVLKPEHEVLNEPNKITPADFDNWVQERGLYFPHEWDEKYDAILSANDPGEDAKDGGLLIAKFGGGYYIYSGYSWFRQLPAGVPGAYRLFTNLISIGKNKNNP